MQEQLEESTTSEKSPEVKVRKSTKGRNGIIWTDEERGRITTEYLKEYGHQPVTDSKIRDIAARVLPTERQRKYISPSDPVKRAINKLQGRATKAKKRAKNIHQTDRSTKPIATLQSSTSKPERTFIKRQVNNCPVCGTNIPLIQAALDHQDGNE